MSSRKGSSSPTSCRDSEMRESRMRQLPRRYAAGFVNAPPEGKIATAGRRDAHCVGAQREKLSATSPSHVVLVGTSTAISGEDKAGQCFQAPV
jgi:hypothetical protein